MTSGQDVSEFLDTLGLVKSYFSSFLENFFFCGAPTPQRIRRFACLQDYFLTLTCHLAYILDTLRNLGQRRLEQGIPSPPDPLTNVRRFVREVGRVGQKVLNLRRMKVPCFS